MGVEKNDGRDEKRLGDAGTVSADMGNTSIEGIIKEAIDESASGTGKGVAEPDAPSGCIVGPDGKWQSSTARRHDDDSYYAAENDLRSLGIYVSTMPAKLTKASIASEILDIADRMHMLAVESETDDAEPTPEVIREIDEELSANEQDVGMPGEFDTSLSGLSAIMSALARQIENKSGLKGNVIADAKSLHDLLTSVAEATANAAILQDGDYQVDDSTPEERKTVIDAVWAARKDADAMLDALMPILTSGYKIAATSDGDDEDGGFVAFKCYDGFDEGNVIAFLNDVDGVREVYVLHPGKAGFDIAGAVDNVASGKVASAYGKRYKNVDVSDVPETLLSVRKEMKKDLGKRIHHEKAIEEYVKMILSSGIYLM